MNYRRELAKDFVLGLIPLLACIIVGLVGGIMRKAAVEDARREACAYHHCNGIHPPVVEDPENE